MGLFDFFKPKMPNGMYSNDINELTGMTYYQQSMTLMGHCLVLIGQAEKNLYSKSLNKASQIQLLFSKNIMQITMNASEVKDIMYDMKSSLEEMPEEEFMHYTNEGITEMSIGIPEEVKKEILVYLMMFHIIDNTSPRNQAEAIGHIHDMLYPNGGEDPNEIMRHAMKNTNTFNLK